MAEIVRIVIKGSSGYWAGNESFSDKITIAPGSMSYEYMPMMESDTNPKRKWRYTTTSSIINLKHKEIAKMVSAVIDSEITEFCTDIGGIEFNVTFADKTKFKNIYWVPGDHFEDLFRLIKSIVPDCEYVPAVLLTDDDYEVEEKDEDEE